MRVEGKRDEAYWVEVGLRLEMGDISKEELTVRDIAMARSVLKEWRENGCRWKGDPARRSRVVMTGNIQSAQGGLKGITFSRGIAGAKDMAKRIPKLGEVIERACLVDVRGELRN